MACRFAGFLLNPKARLKERVVRRGQGFGLLPRHGSIRIGLTGRTRDNQRGILELRTVDSQHVLKNKLGRILGVSVLMPFNIKTDDAVAFCKQPFCPSAEPAKQIDTERLLGRQVGIIA